MNTYYVRRTVLPLLMSVELITKMSTPRKQDALKSAANSAILNPGYRYYVYENNEQIASFYVKKED